MATRRTNTAKWYENQNRWQIKVMKNGIRKTFTSSKPGRTGQREANAKADAWLESGMISEKKRVHQLYVDFLEDVKVRTSTGNYVNLESIGRVWVLPKIGYMKIDDLNLQILQDVINFAAKKGRSKKTLSNIRGALSAFLHYLRKRGYTMLRCDDIELPNSAPVGKRNILQADALKVLMTSDMTTFRSKPIRDFYIHAYRFLVLTGLRPGELCELNERNQKQTDKICVSGSYNRFKEHTSGKTENAKRTFLLSKYAQEELKAQKNMLKKMGIISPWLFPDKDGSQLFSGTLLHHWKKYQAANELEGITTYELRHTFVSLCQNAVPENLIKSVVGHSSKMPTYETYGHELDSDAETANRLINHVFTEILD